MPLLGRHLVLLHRKWQSWVRVGEAMGTMTLRERELVARQNSLHAIFAPLRVGRTRVALGFASDSPGGTKAIVAADQMLGRLRYREESFRTSVNSLRGRYFELWKVAKGETLELDRAYFTLLRVKNGLSDFKEVLCLHSDPGDEEELKKGPHLHVSCAEDPIPHCHFPLDLGSLQSVLKDCESLTTAMERAIGVVARDVLPRFVTH